MKATGKSALALLIVAQAVAAPAQEGTDADQDALSARVENLEAHMSSQGLMEMFRQMTRLQEEIDRLRGTIEEQNYGLEQLKKRQRDLYADMDRRLQRLEGGPARPAAPGAATAGAGLPGAPTPPLETLTPVLEPAGAGAQADAALTLEVVGQGRPEPTAPGATAAPTTPTDAAFGASPPSSAAATERLAIAPAASDPVQARAAYQRALDLLKQSQYDQSIEALRKFLLAHPRTEYADNAQYWLGEAYYANRQFGQALIEYNALLQRYPDSQKFSHAKLKLAYCYHELGQPGQAKQQLEELIQAYPGTTVAHLARDRLRRIGASL